MEVSLNARFACRDSVCLKKSRCIILYIPRLSFFILMIALWQIFGSHGLISILLRINVKSGSLIVVI